MSTKLTGNQRSWTAAVSAAAGLALILSAPGCASMPLMNSKLVKYKYADEKNPAREILAIWQEAEGAGKNGVPLRGFGGQIYFFSQGQLAPVLVDGTVLIYVFDDHGSVAEQAKPLHMFEFSRESWNAHVQGSHLGPAYTVFIPYPRNDFHQASCSLRIKFVPQAGPTIFSTSSTVVLPGPPLKPGDVAAAGASRASQMADRAVKPALGPQTSAAQSTPAPSTAPRFAVPPRTIADNGQAIQNAVPGNMSSALAGDGIPMQFPAAAGFEATSERSKNFKFQRADALTAYSQAAADAAQSAAETEPAQRTAD